MPANNPSPEYQAIDALIQGGDLERARAELASVDANDESFAVLRIKVGLYDGSLEPGAAMQRLIQLMRRDPEWPAARELYQEASNLAFGAGRSSHSHSHPPPPPKPRKV